MTGVQTCALPILCEPYIRRRAAHHMEKGRIVICAAGTGNPYFTTDSAATLRAAELHCHAILKATKVNRVYTADPEKDPNATLYEKISYMDVLTQDLKVMDAAAIALARESQIPIVVFSVLKHDGLMDVVFGRGQFTVVS